MKPKWQKGRLTVCLLALSLTLLWLSACGGGSSSDGGGNGEPQTGDDPPVWDEMIWDESRWG